MGVADVKGVLFNYRVCRSRLCVIFWEHERPRFSIVLSTRLERGLVSYPRRDPNRIKRVLSPFNSFFYPKRMYAICIEKCE